MSTNSLAGSTGDSAVNAFSIIREVLAYVINFKTPPTPEVYEVWYRFVEGGNKSIREQLSHAIHEAKIVSRFWSVAILLAVVTIVTLKLR